MAPENTPPASSEARLPPVASLAGGADLDRGLDPSETHHAVSVVLQGEIDEIDAAFLERFGARVQSADVSSHPGAGAGVVNLVFTHRSTDLWTTLLTTMHASWTAGFTPVGVTAHVLQPSS